MTVSKFVTITQSLNPFPVLGRLYIKSDFVPLDLSVTNKALKTINVSNSEDLERYIFNYIKVSKAKVAYGGYLEKRGIYNRSSHFNQQNFKTERSIHLGTDLWIKANTPIYTPLDAEIHSFKNNTNYGDYGPTLILKHSFEGIKFYTLYGHLSLESLQGKMIGQKLNRGEKIATLGTSKVNGDYPPHLHFQVILDMEHYKGDYAGVSNLDDLQFYKKNCPDPKLILLL